MAATAGSLQPSDTAIATSKMGWTIMGISSAPVAKICIVCGQNVAGKPRTKDKQGRYYCNPCWTARSVQASQPPQVFSTVSTTQVEAEDPFATLGVTAEPAYADDPLAALANAVPPEEVEQRSAALPGGWFTCPICQSSVTMAMMDESGVCVDCARPRHTETYTPRSSRSRATTPRAIPRTKVASRRNPFLVAIAVISVLVVVSVLVRGTFRPKDMKPGNAVTSDQSNPTSISQQVVSSNQPSQPHEPPDTVGNSPSSNAEQVNTSLLLTGAAWLTRGDGRNDELRGLTIFVLHPTITRPTFSDTYQQLINTLSDETTSLREQRNIHAQTIGDPDIDAMKQAQTRQYDEKLEAMEELGKTLKSASQEESLPTEQVFQAIRAVNIWQEHSLWLLAKEENMPGILENSSQYSHVVKDKMWTTIAVGAFIKKVDTDSTGHYRLELSKGSYVLYAVSQNNFSIAEWTIPIDADRLASQSLDLFNDNATIENR